MFYKPSRSIIFDSVCMWCRNLFYKIEFPQFRDLIQMEQNEYQNFAKKVYDIRDAKKFRKNIKPDTKRYVDQSYKSKLDRISRLIL